jgi:hypothetical protein
LVLTSQPRIAALIAELGLTQFDQFSDGIMILEDEHGQVQRGSGFASMQGSGRLKGGFGALISTISDNIISLTNKTNQVGAAPNQGGPYALFGFIGVPPDGRTDEQVLRQNLLAQFGRLFGNEAMIPAKLYLKDWAFDHLTATAADQAVLCTHPTYGLPKKMIGHWNGKLHFSGTETAPQFGGFLEGALEAAENTLKTLQKR